MTGAINNTAIHWDVNGVEESFRLSAILSWLVLMQCLDT